MLADSMRYPFDSGNLGVSRFWVARMHVIPVTARVEDPWARGMQETTVNKSGCRTQRRAEEP
jgi:hypothetical protein